MTKFNHLMVDIETLDTVETAVILSIAAVRFDIETGELEDDLAYYQLVDIQGQLNKGRTLSADTLTWWMQQSDAARKEAFGDDRCSLSMALNDLHGMFCSVAKPDETFVWANSPSFDLSILKHAYKTVEPGFGQLDFLDGWPFKYYNERDVRTLIHHWAPLWAGFENETPHNPLSDCYYQIKCVCEVMNANRRHMANLDEPDFPEFPADRKG